VDAHPAELQTKRAAFAEARRSPSSQTVADQRFPIGRSTPSIRDSPHRGARPRRPAFKNRRRAKKDQATEATASTRATPPVTGTGAGTEEVALAR